LSFSLFCYANTPQTTDWMPENSFTQGVEGPAVDKNGNLYAVNYSKEGTIGVITAKNTAEIFLTLKKGSIANGIRFDQHDNMYMADYVNHNVLKYSPSSSTVSIFAHNKEMSQPNDLAIMDNGILFASDPNWKESKGRLWRINKDGTSTLLEDNMGTTNGIEVSPDNKTLYVNESVQRTVWRYQLDKAGNISNKALFHQFENHGLDGMRTDKQGNLYIARYGAGKVAVLNPTGQLIKTIDLKGKHPTNVAFGGKSGQQVFVTMQKRGTIETFSNDIAGRLFR
ncbi:MAG: SMP-30/gluconolactonase/LRE family protein, partial [Thalassotalea sp.]